MIKDGLVDIDDISVLKEAEKCASKLCCTDCKAVICEEKCECWTFAKKGVEFGYNKCNEQLIKAKEIIKDYLTIAKGSHTTVCGVPEENRTINVLKLNEEAEQFIKE